MNIYRYTDYTIGSIEEKNYKIARLMLNGEFETQMDISNYPNFNFKVGDNIRIYWVNGSRFSRGILHNGNIIYYKSDLDLINDGYNAKAHGLNPDNIERTPSITAKWNTY